MMQHKIPCGDCPFRRVSAPGWLGEYEPQDLLEYAHGEVKYDCHTKTGSQCAGMAIYRGNMCKSPRDKSILALPANRSVVFSTPKEFINHHERNS